MRQGQKKRNYYQILQVQPDAPDAIIRASYRAHMQTLGMHPDLGGDAEQAALLNIAYQTLINPDKRREYDRALLAEELSQRTEQRNKPQPVTATTCCPFCHHSCQSQIASQESLCTRCRSPLYAARQMQPDELQSKRAISRISKNTPVMFYTEWPQPQPHQGIIRDISPHGLQVYAAIDVSLSSKLKLVNQKFQGIAECVSCQQDETTDGYRLGLIFVTLAYQQQTGNFLSMTI
ncbi:MAG: DnaJ domain-containing protein [Gammaproteobacteria bacterium]